MDVEARMLPSPTNSKQSSLSSSLIISATCLLWAVVAGAQEKNLSERSLRITTDGVEINVATNGCTEKGDFAIVNSGTSIILDRVKKDECKGWFPGGRWIKFKWSELPVGGPRNIRVFEKAY
jgi:hypothetical protein